MQLQGKTALVTGVSSLVGAAIARAYVREGASVVCADADEAVAKEVTANIEARPGTRVVPYGADPLNREEVEQMVAFAQDQFGGLDVLHNHPTAGAPGSVTELGADAWGAAIGIGLTAAWQATKAALPMMQNRGAGVIVNTAPVSALAAAYDRVADNVVHAALVNLTRSTAIDYASFGIRCNAVCFGPVVSSDGSVSLSAADAIPMGRLGEPDEVAAVAAFLASEAASFITGACFVVDGGLGAHTNFAALGSATW